MFPGRRHGNIDGRWTYTWDSENRLVRMEAIAAVPTAAKRRLDFEYDALGRRIRLDRYTHNGSAYVLQSRTKFVYDGWTVVAEFDGSNNFLAGYLWGLDLAGALPDSPNGAGGVGGLALIRQPWPHHFPMYDGNGNIVGLVDATTGSPSATYEYGPFGEPIRATGPLAKANPYRWSTKHTDNDSDLVYYGYRYYNPSTGRWLSRDPIGEAGGKNVYGALGNRPTELIDTLGLEPLGAFAVSSQEVTLGTSGASRPGLRVKYRPDGIASACPGGKVVLVQAVKEGGTFLGWLNSPGARIDTSYKNTEPFGPGHINKITKGGIPPAPYLDTGLGVPDDPYAYLDAPLWGYNDVTFFFEVCAVCRVANKPDQILGCNAFSFTWGKCGKETKLEVRGTVVTGEGPYVRATSPGALYNDAVKRWRKEGGSLWVAP
jgi:RHS repeat-associated protein